MEDHQMISIAPSRVPLIKTLLFLKTHLNFWEYLYLNLSLPGFPQWISDCSQAATTRLCPTPFSTFYLPDQRILISILISHWSIIILLVFQCENSRSCLLESHGELLILLRKFLVQIYELDDVDFRLIAAFALIEAWLWFLVYCWSL